MNLTSNNSESADLKLAYNRRTPLKKIQNFLKFK